MAHLNMDYVTKKEFYKAIEALQASLMGGIKDMMEVMGEKLEQRLEKKLEQKLEEKHEETRVFLGAMIEDAEERFLHTSHDQVSLNGDGIDKHEARIIRLETVTGEI